MPPGTPVNGKITPNLASPAARPFVKVIDYKWHFPNQKLWNDGPMNRCDHQLYDPGIFLTFNIILF